MKNIFLSFVLLVSILLRWYMLPQNLFFGFEQGRDAQIIINIYQKHDFKLVGPKTDLAGIFHGAYYYYLLLPAYVLSHGNSLVGSFFLIVLSSLTAVIGYFFGRDVFGSAKAAALTSVLIAVSYEYIIYARWLSNVTPAIPLIFLCFWLLWKYHLRPQKASLFVSAVVAAVCAAQFEVVLVLLFGWVFVCLFALRIIRWPSWKAVLAAILISGLIFAPHVLFNFRNQNIMVKSMIGFVTGNGLENTHAPLNFSANLQAFQTSYMTSFRRSLSLPNQPAVIELMVLVIVTGLVWSLCKKQKTAPRRASRQKIVFLFVWLFMCIPVLFFHDVAGLTQLYLGIGLAFIFLFVFALQTLWRMQLNQKPIGKILVALSLLVMIFGAVTTTQKLQNNDDVFFVTIQKGL